MCETMNDGYGHRSGHLMSVLGGEYSKNWPG